MTEDLIGKLELKYGFKKGELKRARESAPYNLPPLACGNCGRHFSCGGKAYPLPDEMCRNDCFLDNDLTLKDISMDSGCKAIMWVNICIFIACIVLKYMVT